MKLGQTAPKPFVQPKRQPGDVSWSHLPSGTWREPETLQAHWNLDEHQKNDIRMSSPKQTVQSKQEPRVASALSDEGDSGNEDDGNQTIPTPLFDLSHCQRVGPLFRIHYGKLCT